MRVLLSWIVVTLAMLGAISAEASSPERVGYVNRVEVIGLEKPTHFLVHAIWNAADAEPVLSLQDGEVRNVRRLGRGAIEFELHAPRFTKGGFYRLNIDARVNGHQERLMLENGEPPMVHVKVEKTRHYVVFF